MEFNFLGNQNEQRKKLGLTVPVGAAAKPNIFVNSGVNSTSSK
jgi:hypothetical protein